MVSLRSSGRHHLGRSENERRCGRHGRVIVTKILAGRPKDIDDVRGILRERKSSLNLDLIRETLGLLDQALDRSDLSPLLEDELRKLGN